MPAGIPNSAMSVSRSALGASAWKLRFTRFSGASDISPLQELHFRFLPRLATRSGSRIGLATTFSETLTPSLLRSRLIRR